MNRFNFTELKTAYIAVAPNTVVAKARLAKDHPEFKAELNAWDTAKLESAGGEWKTVSGRHVFIKDGQSVEDALKNDNRPKGQKMHMASRGDYETLPNAPFYLASNEDYASNYGHNLHDVHVSPKKTFDLTHIDAKAEDGALQLKSHLEKKGIDTSGLKFGKEDELAQSLNSNLTEISARIKKAGYDSVSLNEYVYGGGEDQTMLVLDKSIVTHHQRKK